MKYIIGLAVLLMLPESAMAFGKKKKDPAPPSAGPVYSTPNPRRKVVIKLVGTTPFQIPAPGTPVISLGDGLTEILSGSTTKTTSLAPSDPPQNADACEPYLELRAAVTALELDATTVNVHVGYSPSGAKKVDLTASGDVTFKFGKVTMDFGLWKCEGAGNCSQIETAFADEKTLGVGATLTVNFKDIASGIDFLTKTRLSEALRKIMDKGMMDLAGRPGIALLPWKATVFEVDARAGVIWFDAGSDDNIRGNQTFVVAQPVANVPGKCGVTKTVAHVHTSALEGQISKDASQALIDSIFSGDRGVQAGDSVMVRTAPSQ